MLFLAVGSAGIVVIALPPAEPYVMRQVVDAATLAELGTPGGHRPGQGD